MQSLLMLESMQRRTEKQLCQEGENIMKATLLWGSLELILVICSATVCFMYKSTVSQLNETFTVAQTFGNETCSFKKAMGVF